jgi:hypothetical protein
VLIDASFIGQAGTCYRSKAGSCLSKDSGTLSDQDVPAYESVAVLSEAYALYNFTDHLNVTLGKKRIVWGPGFVFNPSDILNPPKDPTNPTLQREGQWLARLEFPYKNFTLSFLGAAKTLIEYGGLPAALVYWPKYPTAEQAAISAAETNPTPYTRPDNAPHFAAAARGYLLLSDTDINVFYYYTNLFNDAFEHKNRGGFSVSRVFGYWEVHFEGLFQQGYSNFYANPSCVTGPTALAECAITKSSFAGYTQTDSSTFIPKMLFGGRYTLDNNGLLSLEYYYNGEGYTESEFKDYVSLVRYGEAASSYLPKGTQLSIPGLPSANAAQTGVPQLFSFNPLRRHYAFIQFQQPQIANDWTVSATLIVDCEDLSGIFSPSLAWTPVEWLSLTVGGFIGIPGVSSWGGTVPGGNVGSLNVSQASYTEFGITPFNWEAYFAVRAFY